MGIRAFSCRWIRPAHLPRRLHQSKRCENAPKNKNFGRRAGRSISYRAMGIARKAPPVCNATTYMAGKATRPGCAVGQKGTDNATPALVRTPDSRRKCTRDTFPNLHRQSHPLNTASSRGRTIGPSNATAAGGESTASVTDSWLPTPRYTGQNFDVASVETEGMGAYRWAARCAVDAIAWRTKPSWSHSGYSRIFLSVDPAGASPASPPSVEAVWKCHIKRNFGRRLGRSISYRALGIARKAPPACNATTYLAGKATRPAATLGKRGKITQRHHSCGAPPPGAGVRGPRFPICTSRRSSLTTASSRGGTIGPSNATADGVEEGGRHQSKRNFGAR